MGRYTLRDKIAQLDPVTQHQEIVFLAGAYEFPFAIQRALEMALFRTFAIPTIAKTLDSTQAFAKYGQKRYDDTAIILAMIAENGYDSEPGRAAIRRMNQLHRRFEITNDDYLYVLSTFIFEPTRWNRVLGWRRFTEPERLANFYFWREVGKRMNIKAIPEDIEAFEQFNINYEKQHFHFNEHSQRVGEDSIKTFVGWFPAFLHPLVRYTIYALLDDPLRETFGFPKAPGWYRALIFGALRLRAIGARWMPPRKKPFLYSELPNRTYPNGYTLDEIGSQPDSIQ